MSEERKKLWKDFDRHQFENDFEAFDKVERIAVDIFLDFLGSLPCNEVAAIINKEIE